MATCLCRMFSGPKSDASPEENEDAVWPVSLSHCLSGSPLRFALADGATETSFAGEWARLLVNHLGGDPWPDRTDLQREVGRLGAVHQAHVEARSLPWFAEEKARQGSAAALLLVEIADDWRSLAIGDCCLFHVRDDFLLAATPLDQSSQFSCSPPLLSSVVARNEQSWPALAARSGVLQPGDMLILATDAVAAWFLGECETRRQPWRKLGSLDAGSFDSWLADERAARRLRDDDSTVVFLEL